MKKFFKSLLWFIFVSVAVNVISGIFYSIDDAVSHSIKPTSAVSITLPAETEPPAPEFYDLISLRDYMNKEKASGKCELDFFYYGSEDITSDGRLAGMSGSMSVYISEIASRYMVTLYKYPGEKIVEAYRRGDTSGLTQDELSALHRAEEIVDFGLAECTDVWELEQFLHDVIAEEVTYYTDDRMNDFEYENAPRYLSVVGALLDGQANCQGYTDAFYTLASMAGFQVSKMSVEAPDGGHQVNTIFLNGQWYVVDVTYDDNDSYPTDYGRFNMGTDLITDYWWEDCYERCPIAEVTDPALYYYYRNSIAFDTATDFAQMIADLWLNTEQTTFFGMVKNETNADILTDVLSAELNETGEGYCYQYSYSCNNQDCFYTVVFEE